MLNQCILVGKVIDKNEDESRLTLTISRNYKDPGDENYKEDEIEIELSENLKRTASEYIRMGATLGVKARIANRVAKVGNREIKVNAIVAEKLTFINTRE